VLSEEWPLRDVLLLTFNSNLGFFERAALARVRARGARVTIVSDADMVHADPEAVRFAGRSYLDGRAICRAGGAFHPKLIVTLGEQQAAVLIGSGNVSPGGWIDNAELWTLLRASVDDGAPATIGAVADFLDGLPDQVRFTPGVTDVLPQISAGLRSFPVGEVGPQLVSTVSGRIIDQLPVLTSSDHLIVATPFHDRNAEATTRLRSQLQPRTVEVLHQKHTLFDGERMAAALETMNGSVARIEDGRYHHGKLIEWHGPMGKTALTGSPNCSRAALLRSLAEGGNCELGLVAPLVESLRPRTGDVEAPATIANREWDDSQQQLAETPAGLLAVILEPDGLRVILRTQLAQPADLQHLADGVWTRLDIVPAGRDEHLVTYRLPGGSALRLLDAGGQASNVIWVADLARTGFRAVTARRSLPSDPVQMALDPHLVTLVENALATVRAWSSESAGPSTHAFVSNEQETAERVSWRDYIDAFRGEVGDEFSFFVLPHLMRAAGAEPTGAPHGGVGEEQEDAELAAEEAAEIETITQRLEALRKSERMAERLRTYRRMCEKLTEPAPRPQPVLIAGTALTVGGAALGCWPDRVELAAQLRRSLRQLGKVADEPDLRVDAANIGAVALAVLRAQVRSPSAGDELALTFRLASREVRSLLVHATEEGITERAAGLVSAVFGPSVTTARIIDLVESVTAPDHVSVAAQLLEVEHRTSCEVSHSCIRLTEPVAGVPWRAALRAIGLAQDAPVVGAVAHGPAGTSAAAWRAPHLVVVNRTAKARRITRYKLNTMLRPLDLSRSEGSIPIQYEAGNWYLGDSVPSEVEELLFEAGILLDEI
jgi:hypothetical protein